jgi:transposase-like protein
MSKGQPRDPRKERSWRQLLKRWQRSGLSIRAFCQQHHCSEPSFYAWRRILEQRDRQTSTAPAPVTFVPLQIHQAAPAQDATLELLLATGRRLRIPPGCSAALLRLVLDVLEDTPC